MKRVSVSIVIDAPVERVWPALYEDMASTVEWVPFVEEVTYVSGPVTLGMIYRERTRLGPIRGESEWQVVAWDPPRLREEYGEAPGMFTRLLIEVQPRDGRTWVRQSAEITSRLPLPGPLRWMHEEIVGRVSKGGLRRAMRGAKLWIEEGKSVRRGALA